ncbi:MAG: anaerobic ribonucleoside-triphosphate reductase activating protein [Firmicutes bacterium]|nr:anaerobic ribonucleoside-triphosphate reductase activating protein [Bacillota bacterium]
MFRGLVKCSLVDYPGKICATLFTGGCNLRCPYCYNKDLVLNANKLASISQAEIMSFLRKRCNLLEGVCLTGGEPLCHEEIFALLVKVKGLGYKVKIDTNGFNSRHLEKLINNDLIDYVALDIKTSLNKYDIAAGRKVDVTLLKETVFLLKDKNVNHEFRTTVVPGLVEKKDLELIGKQFAGKTPYFLQQFCPNHNLLDPSFSKLLPYSKDTLHEMALILKEYFSTVNLRGI